MARNQEQSIFSRFRLRKKILLPKSKLAMEKTEVCDLRRKTGREKGVKRKEAQE